MEGFVDRSSAVSCLVLWFYWRRLWYGDLFDGLVQGSRVSDALFWLTFFLSPILVMCLVGRGLELGYPVVSTGPVLRSLSANHMPIGSEVLLVGELHDYRIVSHDTWTTLVIERCFGVGCLWRAQIVLVTRFVWIFSSWRIDNITFPCTEMFTCWSEGVGIQLYVEAHFFNADRIVSEVACSDHAHM